MTAKRDWPALVVDICQISTVHRHQVNSLTYLSKFINDTVFQNSNMHNNSGLCSMIFIILICFCLTNFLENKNSAGCLKSQLLMEICTFQRQTNFLVKLQCSVFSSATLFLESSQLNFFFSKKFVNRKQFTITNMMLQRPEVLRRFVFES